MDKLRFCYGNIVSLTVSVVGKANNGLTHLKLCNLGSNELDTTREVTSLPRGEQVWQHSGSDRGFSRIDASRFHPNQHLIGLWLGQLSD